MQINSYIFVIIFMGMLFFIVAVLALYWSFKTGQLRDFDKNSRSIFGEDEPEGVQTDFFPGVKEKVKKNLNKV